MGYGYTYYCKKCKKEHTVELGNGFLYQHDLEFETNKGWWGWYGEEYKKLITEIPYSYIETNKYLYYCQKCHHFEVNMEMSIYKINPECLSKDEKEHPTKIYEKIPKLKDSDRILVKEYVRFCPKCQTKLEKKEELNIALECPECGETMEIIYDIHWD